MTAADDDSLETSASADLVERDAAMDSGGTQRDLIARQQLDVTDAGFESRLRPEAAPQEAADGAGRQQRLGGSLDLGEDRVVVGEDLEPPEAHEVGARVADVGDQGMMVRDQHRGERRAAGDEVVVAAALLVEATVRVVERSQ